MAGADSLAAQVLHLRPRQPLLPQNLGAAPSRTAGPLAGGRGRGQPRARGRKRLQPPTTTTPGGESLCRSPHLGTCLPPASPLLTWHLRRARSPHPAPDAAAQTDTARNPGSRQHSHGGRRMTASPASENLLLFRFETLVLFPPRRRGTAAVGHKEVNTLPPQAPSRPATTPRAT